MSASCRRARRAGRCWSASRPKPSDVVEHARVKLQKKRVDLVVANDVSRADAGFDVDTNAVTLVSAEGADEVPLQSKGAVAAACSIGSSSLLASAGEERPGPGREPMSRELARSPAVLRRDRRDRHQPRSEVADAHSV